MGKPEKAQQNGPDKSEPKGNGRKKTDQEQQNDIEGTSSNDLLVGTSSAENIYGLDGDDEIHPGAGNDMLDGGSGSDTYVIKSDSGLNTFSDSGGTEQLQLTSENHFEWDVVEAGYHGTGIYLNGFDSSSGIEEISAAGWGAVSIRGTAYDDVLDFSATTLTDISYIDGLEGDDQITGSTEGDQILGGLGNDILAGGGGDDSYYGGQGSDTYVVDSDGFDEIHDFDPLEDKIDTSSLDLSDTGLESVLDDEGNAILSLGGVPIVKVHDTAVEDLVFVDMGSDEESLLL